MDPLVIVGAGCAGLSLAAHLLEAGEERPIELLESRTRYTDDRTWCSFRFEDHLFSGCVDARWASWEVRQGGRRWRGDCAAHPYEQIRAGAFYEEALRRIRAAPNVRLRLGVRVASLTPSQDHIEVHLGDRVLRAAYVFDSRPEAPEPGTAPFLWQHFRGWRVRSERDRFEAGVATLMDFDVPQRHGFAFRYVLPTSPREALVEATYFTPEIAGPYAPMRDALLADGAFTVVAEERGAIPMTTATPKPTHPRIVSIGLRGGIAKASTGYAFSFIQAHSRALAEARHHGFRVPPRSRWTRYLDEVLLRRLLESPEDGPAVFFRLFERNPPARLARFLSERSSLADDLALMTTVPVWHFAKTALASLPGLPAG